MAMLTVEQALDRILATIAPLEPVRVPILEALGLVLAEDVCAGEDIPPYANSSMDGYAVRAADTAGAGPEHGVRLHVCGEVAAGYVAEEEVRTGTTMRIMTGAPLPEGADAVVKVEDTRAAGEAVEILAAVQPGNYVRPAGEDVRQGERVLSCGTTLRPQEIGMLATLGHSSVRVHRRPRVAILATGDEVTEIDAPLLPGRIRNANSYSNAAQVARMGAVPILLGIARDSVEDLTARIRDGLDQGVDLFLSSGGVSVGHFDLVRDVLAAQGQIDFWRVRMKPGKPVAFGSLGGVPFLGLPGNPVSVMVAFEVFCRPALARMMGQTNLARPTVEAILLDEVPAKDDRRHYVRVHLERRGSEYQAQLTGEQGSGILSSMVRANGLAILPEEWDRAPAGARVQAILLD
jgi:molybdopterin molybdotransferase